MHDPNKVIFNFSEYKLSDCKKRLLAKGLNFSLPPKYLDYAGYLVNFELFYRNICNLGILPNEDLDIVKTRTKLAALSSYRNDSNNVPQHLSKEQFLALQNLRKNKNVIEEFDKGHSVVIVDKADYLDKMENLLNDTGKFEKNNLKNDRIFSFAANQEKLNFEFFMRSLDVDSLFNNIPREETIDICTNTLSENTEKVGFSKIEFKELLYFIYFI